MNYANSEQLAYNIEDNQQLAYAIEDNQKRSIPIWALHLAHTVGGVCGPCWGCTCAGVIPVLGLYLCWGHTCAGLIPVLRLHLCWGYTCWGYTCAGSILESNAICITACPERKTSQGQCQFLVLGRCISSMAITQQSPFSLIGTLFSRSRSWLDIWTERGVSVK